MLLFLSHTSTCIHHTPVEADLWRKRNNPFVFWFLIILLYRDVLLGFSWITKDAVIWQQMPQLKCGVWARCVLWYWFLHSYLGRVFTLIRLRVVFKKGFKGFVEALYFMFVTITTVRYEDYVLNTGTSKWFIVLVIVVLANPSMCTIDKIISKLISWIVSKSRFY